MPLPVETNKNPDVAHCLVQYGFVDGPPSQSHKCSLITGHKHVYTCMNLPTEATLTTHADWFVTNDGIANMLQKEVAPTKKPIVFRSTCTSPNHHTVHVTGGPEHHT